MERHWLRAIDRILEAKTGDFRKLAEIAGEDPTTLYIGTLINGADIRGQDLRGIYFSHLSLDTVQWDAATLLEPVYKKEDDKINFTPLYQLMRSAGRQEERIALMLRAILERKPEAVIYLHGPYVRKGKFERVVFEHLRTKFPLELRNEIDTGDEMIVANMVHQLFSTQYTLARGEILFFLAKHLGEWLVINLSIKQTLRNTRALSVEKYRGVINRMLDD